MRIAIMVAFISILTYAAVVDFRTMNIPQRTHIMLLAVGIINIFATGPPHTLWISEIIGFVAGGLPLYILFALPIKQTTDTKKALIVQRRFGASDVKLAACGGFVLGFWGGYLVVYLALLLYLFFKPMRKLFIPVSVHAPIPFAPFYAVAGIGAYIFIFFGG